MKRILSTLTLLLCTSLLFAQDDFLRADSSSLPKAPKHLIKFSPGRMFAAGRGEILYGFGLGWERIDKRLRKGLGAEVFFQSYLPDGLKGETDPRFMFSLDMRYRIFGKKRFRFRQLKNGGKPKISANYFQFMFRLSDEGGIFDSWSSSGNDFEAFDADFYFEPGFMYGHCFFFQKGFYLEAALGLSSRMNEAAFFTEGLYFNGLLKQPYPFHQFGDYELRPRLEFKIGFSPNWKRKQASKTAE